MVKVWKDVTCICFLGSGHKRDDKKRKETNKQKKNPNTNDEKGKQNIVSEWEEVEANRKLCFTSVNIYESLLNK